MATLFDDPAGWLFGHIGPTNLEADGEDQQPRMILNFEDFEAEANAENSRLTLRFKGAEKLDGLQRQGGTSPISIVDGVGDVDWSLGGQFWTNLDAGANEITFSNREDGWSIVVILTGDTSTVTWPAYVKWPGGVEPTQTTSGTDVYTFVQRGTTVYGSAVQDMS